MRLHKFLNESKEISLSKKAYTLLSPEAKSAIDQGEAMNGHTGKLTQAFRQNSDIAKEIVEKFSVVRNYLKKKYGEKIKLFRGSRKTDKKMDHVVLSSGTNDRKVAEIFAGLRDPSLRSFIREPLSDKEIEDAVKKYEKTGFVTVRGYKYKRSKKDPAFYDIFDRNNNFVTDGDDLYEELKASQKEDKQANLKYLKNAVITEEEIDIDRIVGLTNNLNSKEFIVARRIVNLHEGLKLYLDDERNAPSGGKQVRGPDEMIKLLKRGGVDEISLDHDLGDDNRGTGYDVILGIEKEIVMNNFNPPKIKVHSANTSARKKMEQGIQQIHKLKRKN